MLFASSKPYFEAVFFLSLFFAFVNVFILATPINFPLGHTIRIEKGATLSEVAEVLETHHVIKGVIQFKLATYALAGSRSIREGDYYFSHRENLFDVVLRVIKADYKLETLRVTIPEGYSNKQIADTVSLKFSLFDKEEFMKMAPEGYLFPDTYFFLPNVSAQGVVDVMNANFESKIATIQDKIDNSRLTLNEIITLASIVEEEAVKIEDRKIVSGILQSRLEIGMALQVDATFAYINGKNTYALTHEDLKEDSPYNTYTNVGLPPTPISNPGMESILAVLEPTKTDFLYFLSDLDGNIYYAENFEGHQQNREKYLRK